MLFPGEPKPIDGALSPEARAIGSRPLPRPSDAAVSVRPTGGSGGGTGLRQRLNRKAVNPRFSPSIGAGA